MTISIFIFLALLSLATVLFITEVFSVDKVALLTAIALMTFGLVSPQEAISGFSNPAVITILCLMIISAALEINGSISLIANALTPIVTKSLAIALPLIMLLVGSISAFISTTAVVILFVKIMPTLAQKHNLDLKRFMMPISFAGILGGSCTLMGTSTNLLVDQIAKQKGLPGFSFFEFSAVGLCLLIVGIATTFVVSTIYLKYATIKSPMVEAAPDQSYIVEVQVKEGSEMIGTTYQDSGLYKSKESRLLHIKRKGRVVNHPSYFEVFELGDILVIRTTMERVIKLRDSVNLSLVKEQDMVMSSNNGTVLEVLILPDSPIVDMSFSKISPYDLKGGVPIALRKHKSILNRGDNLIQNRMSRVRVEVGDRLLVEVGDVTDEQINEIAGAEVLNVLPTGENSVKKKYFSLVILAAVILFAASGAGSILQATLLGVGALILSQCITLERAYKEINWQIIFLLAGLLPLGIAMTNTQCDIYISYQIISSFNDLSPQVVLALIFFLTMMISSVVSNNATAIIMAPIALAISQAIGVSPQAFLLAVMFAANFSFFTPIGYQTNTIVYGLGIYRFLDFVVIGGVVSFVLAIVSIILLPMFFPF